MTGGTSSGTTAATGAGLPAADMPAAGLPAAGPSPVDFRITLPPGWVRLPLDDRADATIALLAKRRAALLAVNTQESACHVFTTLFREAVEQGRRAGGLDVLLSVDPVEGISVPASCLISYVEADPATRSMQDLLDQLASDGADTSLVQLDVGLTVRRHSRRFQSIEEGADPMADIRVTEVAYWLPVPGRSGLLAISFSTVADELADALVTLFDAMADTFWWVMP